MQAFLKAIDYYLPQNVVTNADLAIEFPEWSSEKITSKVGIEERHIASENETALDMAVNAAEKLFNQGLVKKENIDFILFCTQSPDYKLPTSACIIQDKLGLPTSVGALDYNLGCSGYVYGLSLAKGLIVGGIANNVLLLTGETYSKYLLPSDKGNRTIFGDAATASVISNTGSAKIGNFSFGTDGSGANDLIIKTGASRNPEKENQTSIDENDNIISPDYLYMNGSNIFSFTLKSVPSLVNNVINKNFIKEKDIDYYVFHQANKYMLDFLKKKLKIEDHKFYEGLAKVGNTVSNTVPIALKELMSENKLQKNEKILLAGFGVGLRWAGCMIEIDELKKDSYHI